MENWLGLSGDLIARGQASRKSELFNLMFLVSIVTIIGLSVLGGLVCDK